MTLNYLDTCDDELLEKVVIVAFRNGKYVFVKRRDSAKLELPAVSRKKGISVEQTARDELIGKIGAVTFDLRQITAFSVEEGDEKKYGMLFYADIIEMGVFPQSEIGSVYYLDLPPESLVKWRYPEVQPELLEMVKSKASIT